MTNGLPPDDQSGGGDYQPRPADLDRATELKLIDAALLNDMQAFSTLFEHYRSALYGLCCRRLNDPSLAEDVVQEVFLKAFKNISSFDRSKLVWPWLATIANRMCVDLQRHRALTQYFADPRMAVDEDAETNGHTESALDEVIASEDRAELWESLKFLPKRQRRALLLYAQDGMSYADIAAAEGISIGAVELLIVRARRKLRQQAGRPLPAIVFPFTWLRWKLQRMEERVRPLLSAYSEGWSSACGAVCLGAVATMMVATGNSVQSLERDDPTRSNESVLSATQSRSQQTVLPQTALPNIGDPAKAPVEPQQSIPSSTNSLVGDVINPNQDATPENTHFYSITASPNYESDHTILAVGYRDSPNYVLFVSHDGGGTWKPRPSLFLDGATVVLPPSFPQDGRIFTSGGILGLQQSDDGGTVFRKVSPSIGRGLAISPSFGRENSIAGRDSRILISGYSVSEYDAGTGISQPALLNLPPAPWGEPYSSIAFSPSYQSDSTIFVAHEAGTSYRCKGSVCDVMQLPQPGGPLTLQFSPRFAQDGLAYAFTPWNLLVSDDGAQTFGEIEFPLKFQDPLSNARSIHDMAILFNTPDDPAIFVSANWWPSSSQFPSGVYRSFDSGRSWSRTSIDLPGFGYANKLIATPTGRLLATGISNGIACSLDKGQTWAHRCPPE